MSSSEETRRWETVSPSSQQSPADEHSSQVCERHQIFYINIIIIIILNFLIQEINYSGIDMLLLLLLLLNEIKYSGIESKHASCAAVGQN